MRGGTRESGGGIVIAFEGVLGEPRGVSVGAALWMCVVQLMLERNVW
jgi:hypothetical protein